MALLTRDQVFAADDTQYVVVPVPEWGGEIRLKSLSGAERDAFEQSSLSAEVEVGPDGESRRKVDLANIRAKLVAACAVDESGQRMFTADDIEALGRRNGAALDRLKTAAEKLSKLRKKDLEELVKNSAAPAAPATGAATSTSA